MVVCKAPVQHALRLFKPVGAGKRHADQLHALALGGKHEAAPRVRGIAGLAAGRAREGREQAVFAYQHAGKVVAHPGDGGLLCAGDAAEVPVLHRLPEDAREGEGAGFVAVGVEAVGVDKMRVRAQFRRARVHPRRERLRAAGHMLGDGDGGVVAAAQKQAVEHLLHGQCLAHAQIDGRARHAAGVFRGRHFLVQRAVLQRQQRGHDLRGRGHGEALVLVLAKKHAAALRVDQHRAFSGHGQLRRRALSRAHGQKEQEKQYADDPLHGASLPPMHTQKAYACAVTLLPGFAAKFFHFAPRAGVDIGAAVR